MHSEFWNLWLFAETVGKVAVLTGVLPGMIFVVALRWAERSLHGGEQIYRRVGLAAGSRASLNRQFSNSVWADQGIRREWLPDRRRDCVGEGKDRGLQQSVSVSGKRRDYHEARRSAALVAETQDGSREASSGRNEQSVIVAKVSGRAVSRNTRVALQGDGNQPAREVRRSA